MHIYQVKAILMRRDIRMQLGMRTKPLKPRKIAAIPESRVPILFGSADKHKMSSWGCKISHMNITEKEKNALTKTKNKIIAWVNLMCHGIYLG
jgi:hypothetical protein